MTFGIEWEYPEQINLSCLLNCSSATIPYVLNTQFSLFSEQREIKELGKKKTKQNKKTAFSRSLYTNTELSAEPAFLSHNTLDRKTDEKDVDKNSGYAQCYVPEPLQLLMKHKNSPWRP